MQKNATRAGDGFSWTLGWLLGSLHTRIERLRKRPRGLGSVLAAACLLLLVGALPEVAPGALLPRRNVHLLGGPLLALLQGAGLVLGLRWVRVLTSFVLGAGLAALVHFYAIQALPATPGWLLLTGAMAAALTLLLAPPASDYFRAQRTPPLGRAPVRHRSG